MGHIENDASNNSSIVPCVLVTGVTFLPSRCLEMIGAFLPRRCLATIGDTHRDTQTDGRDFLIRPLDGLRCHDIRIKFNKDWFRHLKFNTHTDSNVIS
jgi:hypothetical protein